MYNALTIAKKILYFVQAEFLVLKNRPCFREDIVASSFGPIVSEVYSKYAAYGGAHIPMIKKVPETFFVGKDDKEIIDSMIEECMKYSASDLTN